MRKDALISLLMTVLACLGGEDCMSQTGKALKSAEAISTLSKGISCLVSQDWIKDELRDLGLRVGDTAKVAYQTGSIPGISPEAPDTTNVLLFSRHGNRGWLVFFRTSPNGSIAALGNAYRVRREGREWVASEGNGGIGTYKAMGDLATDLAKHSPLEVKLKPVSNGCRSEN
jgi:hypothetical protein